MSNKSINAFVDGTNKTENAFVAGANRNRTGADYMTWDDSDPHTWDDSYPHNWEWQKPSFTTGGTNKTRNSYV